MERETRKEIADRLKLLARKFAERGDEPTYSCPRCLDRGYLLEERMSKIGYVAMYARPCDGCTVGRGIARREREDREAAPQVGYREVKNERVESKEEWAMTPWSLDGDTPERP